MFSNSKITDVTKNYLNALRQLSILKGAVCFANSEFSKLANVPASNKTDELLNAVEVALLGELNESIRYNTDNYLIDTEI